MCFRTGVSKGVGPNISVFLEASDAPLEPIADDESTDMEAHNGALQPLQVYLKLI